MVFKRRDRRPWWRVFADLVYPKGGWKRAFYYVQHRLHRLPGSPERIARGLSAGVFTCFTPFYGLHFVIAALLARLFQGNILAALLGTFFGNPLTYVPIGVASLTTGQWLLGMAEHPATPATHETLGHRFVAAGADLWNNLVVLFTGGEADWNGLVGFYDQVFFPYMVGGVLPGLITAGVAYYLAVPVIRAYQNRRQGAIKQGLGRLRKRQAAGQVAGQVAGHSAGQGAETHRPAEPMPRVEVETRPAPAKAPPAKAPPAKDRSAAKDRSGAKLSGPKDGGPSD